MIGGVCMGGGGSELCHRRVGWAHRAGGGALVPGDIPVAHGYRGHLAPRCEHLAPWERSVSRLARRSCGGMERDGENEVHELFEMAKQSIPPVNGVQSARVWRR